MQALGMAIAMAEDRIERKVKHKFHVIAERKEQETRHRQEVRSWAKIADREMYKQCVYSKRKELRDRLIALGICDTSEAYNMSKTLLPMD